MGHLGKQLKGHLHEKKRTFNKVPSYSWDSNWVYQVLYIYNINPPKKENVFKSNTSSSKCMKFKVLSFHPFGVFYV